MRVAVVAVMAAATATVAVAWVGLAVATDRAVRAVRAALTADKTLVQGIDRHGRIGVLANWRALTFYSFTEPVIPDT